MRDYWVNIRLFNRNVRFFLVAAAVAVPLAKKFKLGSVLGYLVAGIGDAMATWYEAHVCMGNDAAMTCVGARPTIASSAIGEACCRTLFDQGRDAAAAVRNGSVDAALEAVVETALAARVDGIIVSNTTTNRLRVKDPQAAEAGAD